MYAHYEVVAREIVAALHEEAKAADQVREARAGRARRTIVAPALGLLAGIRQAVGWWLVALGSRLMMAALGNVPELREA
jgi:hypothetical protein